MPVAAGYDEGIKRGSGRAVTISRAPCAQTSNAAAPLEESDVAPGFYRRGRQQKRAFLAFAKGRSIHSEDKEQICRPGGLIRPCWWSVARGVAVHAHGPFSPYEPLQQVSRACS